MRQDVRANERTSIADAHRRASPSSMSQPSQPSSMFTADIFTADAHRRHRLTMPRHDLILLFV